MSVVIYLKWYRQDLIHQWYRCLPMDTPPKTNIAPKIQCLEDAFPIKIVPFQGTFLHSLGSVNKIKPPSPNNLSNMAILGMYLKFPKKNTSQTTSFLSKPQIRPGPIYIQTASTGPPVADLSSSYRLSEHRGATAKLQFPPFHVATGNSKERKGRFSPRFRSLKKNKHVIHINSQILRISIL